MRHSYKQQIKRESDNMYIDLWLFVGDKRQKTNRCIEMASIPGCVLCSGKPLHASDKLRALPSAQYSKGMDLGVGAWRRKGKERHTLHNTCRAAQWTSSPLCLQGGPYPHPKQPLWNTKVGHTLRYSDIQKTYGASSMIKATCASTVTLNGSHTKVCSHPVPSPLAKAQLPESDFNHYLFKQLLLSKAMYTRMLGQIKLQSEVICY